MVQAIRGLFSWIPVIGKQTVSCTCHRSVSHLDSDTRDTSKLIDLIFSVISYRQKQLIAVPEGGGGPMAKWRI